MFILLRQLANIRRQSNLNRGNDRRSLALRHVDAGSCNGCEHELNTATNPYHDLQRFGLDIVASPRHADILLITGPITTRMTNALITAYQAMPEPRLIAALGNCALGCNLLGNQTQYLGSIDHLLPVDIRIPGCPPTPNTIAKHLLTTLNKTNAPERLPTPPTRTSADHR